MVSLRNWPVFFYVPNLIGYIRIILSIIAFARYQEPNIFVLYYVVGFVLDAADGFAARKLDQSSDFGAQLDMLTDRCATAALLTLLSRIYPSYAWLCFSLVILDGYSHWVQMASSMTANATSHKSAVHGWLLSMYYKRFWLTFICTLNEFCFVFFYIRAFTKGPILFGSVSLLDLGIFISAPVSALKQIISVRQVMSAHESMIITAASQEREKHQHTA